MIFDVYWPMSFAFLWDQYAQHIKWHTRSRTRRLIPVQDGLIPVHPLPLLMKWKRW